MCLVSRLNVVIFLLNFQVQNYNIDYKLEEAKTTFIRAVNAN